MEVTKWLKPSISVSRIGDSASAQAETRVNAEQTSKRTMRRPTRQPFRGAHPEDEFYHVSHETIYRSLFVRQAKLGVVPKARNTRCLKRVIFDGFPMSALRPLIP
jgi:hypothetical protein